MKKANKTNLEKLQINLKDKQSKLANLQIFEEELSQQIKYDDKSNFVIITINKQTSCRSGLLDETSFSKAVESIVPNTLTNKERILREGFSYAISNINFETTISNQIELPTIIFKNFKKYVLKCIILEIEKTKESIVVLNEKINYEEKRTTKIINENNNNDLTLNL